MIDCRNNKKAVFALVALTVLFGTVGWRAAGLAQVPPKEPAVQAAPLPEPPTGAQTPDSAGAPAPQPVKPGAPPAIQEEPVKKNEGVVEVDPLDDIDPQSVGVLDVRDGGFGPAMWNGTSRQLATRLLPLIPAKIRSPVLRDLARRLLLSRAAAPAGRPGEKSLLSIRVNRLQALGDVRGAIQLIKVGASEKFDENLALVEVESRFIDNDNAGACDRVKEWASKLTGDYWLQAQAYCLALAGKGEQASMVSDIMRERGAAQDAVFFTLLDGLGAAEPPVLESMPEPRGLLLSMARAANVALPRDVVEADNLAILRTVAFSPNADLNLRLIAVERLLDAGAIRAQDVADIYTGAEFDPSEVENPLAAAEANWNARTRALLVQAASRISAPRGRIAMLRSAWKLARQRGNYTTLLHASAAVLTSFSATDDLIDVSRDVGYALFATGNTDKALEWFRLAQRHAATNPAAAEAVTALWPLAHIADVGGALPWEPSRLDAWFKSIDKARPKTAAATATAVYGLLNAVGKKVPAAVWATLVGRGGATTEQVQNPAIWGALREAANGGRRAETVIYILLAIGAESLDQAGPQSIATVVKALTGVGFESEARRLALEAAIAAGA